MQTAGFTVIFDSLLRAQVKLCNSGKIPNETVCRCWPAKFRFLYQIWLTVGNFDFLGAYKVRHSGPTQFRKFYERGDFPIALEHDTKGNRISWKVEVEKLDYHHYLPLFFDGLCETAHPHEFFARQGKLLHFWTRNSLMGGLFSSFFICFTFFYIRKNNEAIYLLPSVI